jgi:hypothetical protein
MMLFVVALGVMVIRRQFRVSLVPLMAFGLSWAFILVTTAWPTARYLVLGYPFALIFIALMLSQPKANILFAAAVPIVIVYGGVFAYQSWTEPEALDLSNHEEWEYMRQWPAGFGVDEAAADIVNLPTINGTIPVVGFMGNCKSLPYYWPEYPNVNLACPYYRYQVSDADGLWQFWNQQVQEVGAYYFLVERGHDIDVTQMDITPELIGYYTRPHNGLPLWLYRVTPGERNPDAWFQN